MHITKINIYFYNSKKKLIKTHIYKIKKIKKRFTQILSNQQVIQQSLLSLIYLLPIIMLFLLFFFFLVNFCYFFKLFE